MALSDFDLQTVTDEQITEARRWLLATLAETFPGVDFSRGAVYGTVVLPLTLVLGAMHATVDAVRNSHDITRMLSGALDDTELAAFLRNYRVYRQPARAAGGPTARRRLPSRPAS